MTKTKLMVISPHPDDEILGCGGYLLNAIKTGHEISWIIMTRPSKSIGWNKKQIDNRKKEIDFIRKELGIHKKNLFNLNFISSELDTYPLGQIIKKIKLCFDKFKPEILLLPHYGDIHSDHKITFEAAISSSKWFRCNSINKIMTYETLSETDFLQDQSKIFFPNIFVDISENIEKKIKLMSVYKSEIGKFPFPRSSVAIKSLARIRGAASGFDFAESFMLMKERIKVER